MQTLTGTGWTGGLESLFNVGGYVALVDVSRNLRRGTDTIGVFFLT